MKNCMLSFILALSVIALAAEKNSHLNLSLDVAQFLGSDGQSYLEIYYSVPEKEPVYALESNLYTCDVLMSLEIFQDDSLWANKTWRVTNTLADTAHSDKSRQLVDLLRYPVAPNHRYQITLFARDTRKSSLDSISVDFSSANFSGTELFLSDMQLGNSITPYDSSCTEAFRKRFYCIVPNPESTFGSQNKDLFFYFEAYNLQQNISAQKIRIITKIFDYHGEPLTQVAPIIHERDLMQNTIREIGQFPVSDIPSGTYKLEFAIMDSSNAILIKKAKIFLIQNPKLKPLSPVFAQGGQTMTFLDDFDLKKIDDEFDKLYAVTNKDDRDIYRSIREEDAKRIFLYQFWTSITPPGYASTLDFRIRYMQECQYVDTYYTRPGKPGWRTDRGVTYLRFGKPSDVERHTVSQDTKPYEIWHYENLENGVLFIFVDRMGFNQYELIHSTKRGELYNPNWERLIQPSATDSFSM
jgi:GWxTD domain-containing protein